MQDIGVRVHASFARGSCITDVIPAWAGDAVNAGILQLVAGRTAILVRDDEVSAPFGAVITWQRTHRRQDNKRLNERIVGVLVFDDYLVLHTAVVSAAQFVTD